MISFSSLQSINSAISEELAILKNSDLEKYIRMKLGQKTFPTPSMKQCLFKGNNDYYCKTCKNCKYNQFYYSWKKEGHLRFDFDSRKFIKNNSNILQLFEEYLNEIKVVIHSHQGFIQAYFIKLEDYVKYDYWGQSYNTMKFPYIICIDLTGLGTIEIIKIIIERIHKITNGCQLPGNCGYVHNTLCDTCVIRNVGIIPSIFNFKIKKITLFNQMFPKTTKMIFLNKYDNEYGNHVIIDCNANFTQDEKKVIDDYQISNIHELMNHHRIHKIDKKNCLTYYKYMIDNYYLNGFEILHSFVKVQFDNYLFNLIVLHDETIKYCSSSGEKIYID